MSLHPQTRLKLEKKKEEKENMKKKKHNCFMPFPTPEVSGSYATRATVLVHYFLPPLGLKPGSITSTRDTIQRILHFIQRSNCNITEY